MHTYLPLCQVMKSPHMHTLAPLWLVGTPFGCPPHLSPSTLSQFFAVSPVKTGMHLKTFIFSALGLHPHHLPTMLSPGVTFMHLMCTPHAPLCTPMHFLHSIFQGWSPLSDFQLTLDPFSHPRQLSLSATGHSTPPQTSVESSPDLAAPIPPTHFPVGPHNPHKPSKVTISKAALLPPPW